MRSLKEICVPAAQDTATRARKLNAMGRLSDDDCEAVVAAANNLEAVILATVEPTDEERSTT